MTLTALVGILAVAAFATAQQQPYEFEYQGQAIGPHSRPSSSAGLSRAAAIKPSPVAIIKQINKHNDDGSYTYGYEGADGSFKIETKLPTGEVTGKYGYVDDTGKLRVVDYGANRYGFQPAGEGITVAPPTLVDETTDRTKQNGFAEYDDEGILYSRPVQAPQPQPQPLPAPRPVARQQPKRPRPAPQPRPVQFAPEPRPVQYAQQPRPVQYAPQPRPVQYAPQPQYVTYEPESRTVTPTQFQQIPQPSQAPIPVQQIPQQISSQYPQTFITYEGQPRPAPRGAPAPAPPRAVVPGAVQAGPLFRPNALPSPIAAAAPVPAPVRPAPVREAPLRAAPAHPSASVLDQLIQQYALPQGVGQPLHDISFGSYASPARF